MGKGSIQSSPKYLPGKVARETQRHYSTTPSLCNALYFTPIRGGAGRPTCSHGSLDTSSTQPITSTNASAGELRTPWGPYSRLAPTLMQQQGSIQQGEENHFCSQSRNLLPDETRSEYSVWSSNLELETVMSRS